MAEAAARMNPVGDIIRWRDAAVGVEGGDADRVGGWGKAAERKGKDNDAGGRRRPEGKQRAGSGGRRGGAGGGRRWLS